jgi:hypothetical protein
MRAGPPPPLQRPVAPPPQRPVPPPPQRPIGPPPRQVGPTRPRAWYTEPTVLGTIGVLVVVAILFVVLLSFSA